MEDPRIAADSADVLYTDVWTSMGQETESIARRAAFAKYQIDNHLVKLSKLDSVVMHCLPAHRNEEIAEDVLESRRSVVFHQAENRLHIQKAVLATLFGASVESSSNVSIGDVNSHSVQKHENAHEQNEAAVHDQADRYRQ
jgi:ornithine carbamoyltransferase